jgi:hypothetical protein
MSTEPNPPPNSTAAEIAAAASALIPFVYVGGLVFLFRQIDPGGGGRTIFFVWFWAGLFACLIGLGLGVQALVWVAQSRAAVRPYARSGWVIVLAVIGLVGNIVIPAGLWLLWTALKGMT